MEDESLELLDSADGFRRRRSANSPFHQNLQQFATKVGYISSLQTGGKLPPEAAYEQIHSLYTQLKQNLRTS
jgi:hypothetical protein